MKKLPWIISIVLLAVIAILVFSHKKDAVPVENKGTPVAPITTPEPQTSGPILGGAEEKTINEDSQYMKVNIKYPSFKNADISKDIREFILSSISNFKTQNNIDALSQADKDFQFQNGAKYEINSVYKIYDSKSIATVMMSISDYTGGAHGGLAIKSLNYNKAGSRISIGDLFKPESAYLSKLSTLSRAKLAAKLGDTLGSWSNDGTAPVSANFETFYLSDNDKILNVVFQPYQVAPWVAGAPEISIDIQSELGDIINSQIFAQ